MDNDEEKRNREELTQLKTKLEYVEKDIAAMKKIQEEHGKLIQESAKEGVKMFEQIDAIKNMLEDIAKRRYIFYSYTRCVFSSKYNGIGYFNINNWCC